MLLLGSEHNRNHISIMPETTNTPRPFSGKDLTGEKFMRWTVVGIDPDNKRHLLCRCDCGSVRSVYRWSLTRKKSRSCGCFRDEVKKKHSTTHNMANTPEYESWQGCKKRCYNKRTLKYPRYGGRGIKVCNRWLTSFENFLSDMGMRPSPKHSLHRVDNDGNYEPSNCVWATPRIQSRNTSKTRFVVFNGKRLPLAEHAEREGLDYKTVHSRLQRGYSMEMVFSKKSFSRTIRRRGQNHHGAVLNDEKVREIRRLRASGKIWKQLARIFKVSQCAVRLAAIGKTWSHVK